MRSLFAEGTFKRRMKQPRVCARRKHPFRAQSERQPGPRLRPDAAGEIQPSTCEHFPKFVHAAGQPVLNKQLLFGAAASEAAAAPEVASTQAFSKLAGGPCKATSQDSTVVWQSCARARVTNSLKPRNDAPRPLSWLSKQGRARQAPDPALVWETPQKPDPNTSACWPPLR